MADEYRIDSHKLIYHPERVSQWLNNGDRWENVKKVYPIYVEISPVGHCNHRCTFCALDFAEYVKRSLDYDILKERLTEMARLGIKSVMFAGEGEPTLYKNLPETLEHCSKVGIDASLTTNLAVSSVQDLENYVKNCKWIKVSINGGDAETYSSIHQASLQSYSRVLENLEHSVRIKRENNYSCTIGAQLVLLPENKDSVEKLTKDLIEIGLDYLVIKPYSQHPQSVTQKHKNIDYSQYIPLQESLIKYNSEDFKVVFRLNTMKKSLTTDDRYSKCYSVPFFWAYLMSDGSVYGCSMFLGDERFNYGNISDSTFKEIWEGEKRRLNYEYVKNTLDANSCRVNCRMDEINRYLWELRHPSEHVNFI